MQDASNAEMRRQIKREGRRWGLVPLERDGRVCVGQVARKYVQHGSQPGFTVDETRYVADVTMGHGFSGALLNLRRLEQRDMNELYDERQRKIRQANDARFNDKMQEHDATADRFIRRMGWQAFVEALLEPDPRGVSHASVRAARVRR